MTSRHSIAHGGISEVNITPLADVTTTLIVVFLVALPTLLWSGIQVQSKAATQGSQHIVQPTKNERVGLLTVAVNPGGITLNQRPIALSDLEDELRSRLASRQNRTVVIVPNDQVYLGDVVSVLDIAKASGATDLALLNFKQTSGGRSK
jgi:biopolymer transport protein ExbD